MNDFIISSDTTCDLPESYIKDNNIDIHVLYYSFGNTIYGDENNISPLEFYQKMENGELPTTMASNPAQDREHFENLLKKGYDILHISFSSALSSSFNNASIAADELMEEYPDRRIVVIDSLSASLGEGLLVYHACELKKSGKSMEEIEKYLLEYIPYACHQFTVSNLNDLYRGGRVSRTTAFLGTLANIKPILHCNIEGKLIPIGKVRGRKKSLDQLIDNMEERMGRFKEENDVVFLGRGSDSEAADYIAGQIEERFGIKVIQNIICPTIGAHTGPSIIALFFLGEKR